MLMSQLQTMANARGALIDQVSFASLNVFGRTIAAGNIDGRQHNPNHQVSITIGKPFKPGIIGGIAPVGTDFGAVAIGSVAPTDTLASFGKTLMKAAGSNDDFIGKAITSGTVIDKALA
jgi:hypothetical protein